MIYVKKPRLLHDIVIDRQNNRDGMTNKKRDITFDIARSLCILWIVGVWHLKDYVCLDGVSENIMSAGDFITTAVLGAFTFMSGFFLKKYKMRTVSDALLFYRKRLLRFWVLYFLASASIYIASTAGGSPWFTSPMSFVLSLLGLSVFFPPLPSTFWYISMLMLFYLMTPLLLVPLKCVGKMILYVTVEAVLTIFWLTGVTEDQCMVFFPMYALGMLLSDRDVGKVKSGRWWVIVCVPVLLILSLLINHKHIALLCWQALALPLLVVLSDLLARNRIARAVGRKVSYASMNMYLFHRHVFLFSVLVLNAGSLHNIRDAVMPLWVAVLVVVPVITVFSYFLQKVYDRMVSKALSRVDGFFHSE